MNVYELVEALGGEIVTGRARVRQGDVYIELGRVTPEGMVMTPEGKALADAQEQATEAPKRTRKKAAVEVAPSVEEPSDEG